MEPFITTNTFNFKDVYANLCSIDDYKKLVAGSDCTNGLSENTVVFYIPNGKVITTVPFNSTHLADMFLLLAQEFIQAKVALSRAMEGPDGR